MKKIVSGVIALALMVPLMAPRAFSANKATQAEVADAGNKICPVMGEPVNGSDFVIYKGTKYGLCCAICKKKFLENPEKYIAKMNAAQRARASNWRTIVTPIPADEPSLPTGSDLLERRDQKQ